MFAGCAHVSHSGLALQLYFQTLGISLPPLLLGGWGGRYREQGQLGVNKWGLRELVLQVFFLRSKGNVEGEASLMLRSPAWVQVCLSMCGGRQPRNAHYLQVFQHLGLSCILAAKTLLVEGLKTQ